MIDLGFSGRRFTWNHNTNAIFKKSSRLDRGLCDEEWRRSYPEVSIKHLSFFYSDHCPILLKLSEGTKQSFGGAKPFRF